jgi:peroxiredoxin
MIRVQAHAPWAVPLAVFGVVLLAASAHPMDAAPLAERGAPSSESPAAEQPLRRAYASPPESKLGTLPEGIGISIGESAPDALVHDFEGREVHLRELTKAGPVLLVFYRGGWCPYCNSQIHDLTTAYPEYRKRGVTPVAISVDRAEESARTQATYAIPFPVLSDPGLVAHRAFHVVHQVDKAEFARLQGYGIDLEKASGSQHHVIAVPSLFVIDGKGTVRWAHADTDYKTRPSTAQILAAIDGLKLGQP